MLLLDRNGQRFLLIFVVFRLSAVVRVLLDGENRFVVSGPFVFVVFLSFVLVRANWTTLDGRIDHISRFSDSPNSQFFPIQIIIYMYVYIYI